MVPAPSCPANGVWAVAKLSQTSIIPTKHTEDMCRCCQQFFHQCLPDSSSSIIQQLWQTALTKHFLLTWGETSHTTVPGEMSALSQILLTLNLLHAKGRGGRAWGWAPVQSQPSWHTEHHSQAPGAKCCSAGRWGDIFSVSWQQSFKPSSHTEASCLESTLDYL